MVASPIRNPRFPVFSRNVRNLVKITLFLLGCPFLIFGLFSQVNEKEVQHIRPAWSYTGEFLAYLSNEQGPYQLYVADFGTLTTQCISPASLNISQFKWSPTQNRLLFLADKEVYVMNLDGSERQLVHTHSLGAPFFFDWTPDGQGLTFSCTSSDGFTKICKKDFIQGDGVQLTTGKFNDRNFHWSSNGDVLTYGSDKKGSFQIYTWQLKSDVVEKRTDLPHNAIDPLFSKDGNYLVFLHDRDGTNTNFEVYLMDLNGHQQVICDFEGYNLPLWHPNGEQLLISTNRNGFWEVFVYQLNDSNLTKLGDGLAFSVSPDGSHILLQTQSGGVNSLSLLDFEGNLRSLSPQLKSH